MSPLPLAEEHKGLRRAAGYFGSVALLSDVSSVFAGGAVKGHCQCCFCVQVSGLKEVVPSGPEISKGRLLCSVIAYRVLRRYYRRFVITILISYQERASEELLLREEKVMLQRDYRSKWLI